MSRILVFTGSTGGGHTQVANTLKKELEDRGHEVVISDLLSDYSKIIKFLCVDTYNFLYKRMSVLYGALYRWSNRKILSRLTAIIFTVLIGKKLNKFISKFKPNIIISVHPFGSGVLGRLKEKRILDCITLALITDFKAHWLHVGKGLDFYLVSCAYTKKSLVKKGIDSSIIRSIGIPIRNDFLQKNTNERDDGIFTVLVMGGSGGEKFIKYSLFRISKNTDMNIIVICGNNNELREKLIRKYGKKSNIEIRGYEKNISALMKKADVIVTKPGAVTITEAISQELPIVIPYAIPGHEKDNAKFLVKSGMALRTRSYLRLAFIIEKLMDNPNILESIKGNIQENNIGYSKQELVDIIDNFVTDKGE